MGVNMVEERRPGMIPKERWMMIDISINDNKETPKYQQIIEQIKRRVASSQLIPGERLPTVRELAQTLHTNPATVEQAYRELKREGILVTKTPGWYNCFRHAL